jgi:hypothetical protein
MNTQPIQTSVAYYVRTQVDKIDAAHDLYRKKADEIEKAETGRAELLNELHQMILLMDTGVLDAINNICQAVHFTEDRAEPTPLRAVKATATEQSAVHFVDALNDYTADMSAFGDLLCRTDEGDSEIPVSAIRRVGWMISTRSREMHEKTETWWRQRKP